MSHLPFIGRRKASSKRKAKLLPAVRDAMIREMGKIGYSIFQLMDRPKIPYNIGQRRVELDPEQLLSVGLADRLRELTKQYYETGGKAGLRAAWCHNANERQAGWFTMIILKAMGMLTGAPDYWFVWDGGGCVIELKADGDLAEYQVYFRNWCTAYKAPHAVHRNVDDCIATLIKLGAIITDEGDTNGKEEQSI